MSHFRLIHDKTKCHGLELQSGIAMLPQQPCHQSVSTAHVHPSPGRGFPLTPAPDESICRRSIKIGQNRTPVVKKEAFYRSAHWGGCQCRSPAHAGDTPGLYGVRPVSALLFRGLCRAGTLVACMSDPVCRLFRPLAVARIWKIEFKMAPKNLADQFHNDPNMCVFQSQWFWYRNRRLLLFRIGGTQRG